MYNNAPLVLSLAERLSDAQRTATPRPQLRVQVSHNPCLPARLPSTAFLQREAEQAAPKAIIKQLRRSPTPTSSPHLEPQEVDDEDLNEALEEPLQRPRTNSVTSIMSSLSSSAAVLRKSVDQRKNNKSWKEPQAFEIFRAVEKKDMVFLMEVRDRAFHLLLRRTGDATPLLHAMRIGKSHQDVAIILVGAFSRYVNNLQDEDMALPGTRVLLKALRTNLKLAIDFGLQTSQSDLIPSFLQTLVMSEGDKWVSGQASNVALALRAGTAGKPVQTAEEAVRGFATKELGKAKTNIAALEDYVANATADLVLIAAWSCVLDHVEGEQIPSYYFARDDRVYKAFMERIDKHKRAIERTASRRLRWQIRVLSKVMEGRSTNYRSKVELLAEEFDQGEGV